MQLCFALLGAVLFVGCHSKPAAEAPRLVVRYTNAVPFDVRRLDATAAYIAVVRGDQETDLSIKVGGILERIGRVGAGVDWQEGAPVEKGESLAQLRQEDFVNALASARARAELAEKTFERNQRLLDQGAISQQDFDRSKADRLGSQAALAQCEQDLQNSKLDAPFTGTILTRLVNRGETLPAGRTVLRFANLDLMSVELGVPDKVVARLKVDQEIPLVISALEGRQFKGRVSEVGVAAREGGRLFKVIIKVANPGHIIKSGMTASVALEPVGQPAPGWVLVPLSALTTRKDGRLVVFVVGEDGQAHERPVTTDDFVGSSVVVTDGLKPMEKVVVVGAGLLYDGAPVEAKPVSPL